MMEDRALLEFAAKASGLTGHIYGWVHGPAFIIPGENPVIWNPIADDGDALRLAVQLNIEFACFDKNEEANAGRWCPDNSSWNCMTPYNGDKHSAVRRAIVRAAAEIGRNMK